MKNSSKVLIQDSEAHTVTSLLSQVSNETKTEREEEKGRGNRNNNSTEQKREIVKSTLGKTMPIGGLGRGHSDWLVITFRQNGSQAMENLLYQCVRNFQTWKVCICRGKKKCCFKVH